MDSTGVRSNRKTAQTQEMTASFSRWSKEDDLLLFGCQHGRRHGPLNYDYDFPIEKWSERRVAAEKRQNDKTSSFKPKPPSSRWMHTTQPSKDSQIPDNATKYLLTLCSLINHCEAIPDFERFKGHALIAALVSRPTRAGPTQRSTVKKEGDEEPIGKTVHHVEEASADRDAADDESKEDKRMRTKRSSTEPKVMDSVHRRSSSSRSLRNERSSASLGRTTTSYIDENSESLEHFYSSDSVSRSNSIPCSSASNSAMLDESESTSKQQTLTPVRFCYSRLNAAVQGQLNQQSGPIASLTWRSPVHTPLPLLASPANDPHHYCTGLVESSPHPFRLTSVGINSNPQPCLASMERAQNVYQTRDALSSDALSKPMTKHSVLAALARVRFQAEGTNNASTLPLPPPALPSSRQATRKLRAECDEQQREVGAAIEARGQTYVVHDSSSMAKVQLFHIGDLLEAMDSNRKRETSLARYLGPADVSL